MHLAEVLGDAIYTALTELEYEKPEEQPALIHPGIDEDTTDKERSELKAEQAELREAW